MLQFCSNVRGHRTRKPVSTGWPVFTGSIQGQNQLDASERNDFQALPHTQWGPGNLHFKLLVQVWVMLPSQFRVKGCLGEALGRAGAQLSWLQVEEVKASFRRGAGWLFGSAGGVQLSFWEILTWGLILPYDSRRRVSKEAGLWGPGDISARAETLMVGLSIHPHEQA